MSHDAPRPEPLSKICDDVRHGRVKAFDRVNAFLAAIEKRDGEIHAFNEDF